MPVFDAALDAKLGIIHVRHEAAAVHMADAWGRLTGEPGIALVTGGPGHANAVGALYTALAAESPMLLISGHAPLDELGKGAFQEMRQAEVAAPLAKASWTVQSAQALGADVARALRLARSGTPGPVHLSVPNDVLDAMVDASVPDVDVPKREKPPVERFLPTLNGR
jgi:acetolactate synthase-1/2/3 large subunit